MPGGARPRSGPKPRPRLQVIREGNPGHRPAREGVQLPPGAPPEPDWREWFPTGGAAATRSTRQRARAVARRTWRTVVPVLDTQGVLSRVDVLALRELCVIEARIDQLERKISSSGFTVMDERGTVRRNPAVTAVHQYREKLKFYIAELGLTPSSRGRLNFAGGEGSSDPDDPFD